MRNLKISKVFNTRAYLRLVLHLDRTGDAVGCVAEDEETVAKLLHGLQGITYRRSEGLHADTGKVVYLAVCHFRCLNFRNGVDVYH